MLRGAQSRAPPAAELLGRFEDRSRFEQGLENKKQLVPNELPLNDSPADSGQRACLCSPEDRRASAWPGWCSTRTAEVSPLLGRRPDVWCGAGPVPRLTDADSTDGQNKQPPGVCSVAPAAAGDPGHCSAAAFANYNNRPQGSAAHPGRCPMEGAGGGWEGGLGCRSESPLPGEGERSENWVPS